MANSQYQQKMEEHLNSGTYFLLKKNPTESLSRKLDAVLKKLLKEDKISKSFYDNSRVLHPRAPQIYSLPKIHKPGNPIRPIVSFYDTPLSALHRQLSEVLKPPTPSDIRLKNSEDFLNKFRLQHLEATFLSNGYPLQKIRQLMHTTIERARSNSRMPQSHTNSNLVASIPYFKSSKSSLKKSLARYDISTSFHSNTNLKSLLSHTKSTTPPCNVKNVIYKIPCGDCDQFYIGQTSRPLIKRIKENEACFRLNNYTDDSTGNIKSAPAKHGKENGHRINWKSTSIITSSDTKGQLNLLEHAAISILKPDMNIQHKGPSVNSCWNPLLPKIAATFKNISANIEI